MIGFIHSIETFGAVDGPGIRYVVFMQGCPIRCIFCHNPDTWQVKKGKKTTVKELVNDIKKYQNYISTGGVTISGGEPLLQTDFVYALIKSLHKLNIEVAIDTAGSIPVKTTKKVLDTCDLVLLDIKGLDDELNKTITGASNRNTLETLDYCEKISKPVWIRQVLLPGYTLDSEYLERLVKYLKNFKCVKKIEFIPFHKMGEYKWKELGLDYKLYETPAPTVEQLKEANEILHKYNF